MQRRWEVAGAMRELSLGDRGPAGAAEERAPGVAGKLGPARSLSARARRVHRSPPRESSGPNFGVRPTAGHRAGRAVTQASVLGRAGPSSLLFPCSGPCHLTPPAACSARSGQSPTPLERSLCRQCLWVSLSCASGPRRGPSDTRGAPTDAGENAEAHSSRALLQGALGAGQEGS